MNKENLGLLPLEEKVVELRYLYKGKIKKILFDSDVFEMISSYSLTLWGGEGGHVYVSLFKNGEKIKAHRLITGAPPGMVVDHINGDGLDNRSKNLRVCTREQNNRNRKPIEKNNKTGYKGVTPAKNKNGPPRFLAQISIGNGGKRHLGSFATALEAANAYDKEALELHGDFAWTNARGLS